MAPGLIIDERLFIEELVIPDSSVATTEWHLDFLESWTFCLALNFGALFVIQLLYRYPVSHGSLVGLAMCRCATDQQPLDSIPKLAMPI